MVSCFAGGASGLSNGNTRLLLGSGHADMRSVRNGWKSCKGLVPKKKVRI
jgi:hypothetical protein